MSFDAIQPRVFLMIQLGNITYGFGIVKSKENGQITFSKFDTFIKNGDKVEFKGILEDFTISYSEERTNLWQAYRYFDLCRDYRLVPNFKIEDFYTSGDIVKHGSRKRWDGHDWDIIGVVNHAELKITDFGEKRRKVYFDRAFLYNYGELVPLPEGLLYKEDDLYFFTINSNTRLLTDEGIKSRIEAFELYRDYTIQGLIV